MTCSSQQYKRKQPKMNINRKKVRNESLLFTFPRKCLMVQTDKRLIPTVHMWRVLPCLWSAIEQAAVDHFAENWKK